MTRPNLLTLASAAVAVVVGYHLVRRRHFLRTLAWALTGHPADEADPNSCDGDFSAFPSDHVCQIPRAMYAFIDAYWTCGGCGRRWHTEPAS